MDHLDTEAEIYSLLPLMQRGSPFVVSMVRSLAQLQHLVAGVKNENIAPVQWPSHSF